MMMAKRKKFLLILGMTIVFLLGTAVGSASTYSKKITAWFYPIRIYVDNVPLSLSSPAFIYNNYTYVPIQDIAKHLNYKTDWNNATKRLHLYSHEGSNFSQEALRSELEQKIFKISELEAEVNRLKRQLKIQEETSDSDSSSSNNDKLRTLQDLLEEKYDRHRNNGRTLYFEKYRLSQLSDDTIRVRIYGKFERGSNEWRNMKISEFEDFLRDICSEVNRKFDENIKIIIYDKDGSTIAEYSYDYKKEKMTRDYLYRGSGSSKAATLDEMEDILEEEFESHRNNGETLKFDSYKLTKLSDGSIRVRMYGSFSRDSDKWEDLNRSDFEEFLEDICERINDDFENDIEITVYDKNNQTLAEYEYDFDKGRLTRSYFYQPRK